MPPCGGCQFHSYPYEARSPVAQEGVRENIKFECDQDVWDIVGLCIEETKEFNESGQNFDIVNSLVSQIPFFACNNIFLDKKFQKDIQRYVYCEEFGISPYPGSYGEQPGRWIQKAFIFKKAFNKEQKKAIDNGRKQNTNKV